MLHEDTPTYQVEVEVENLQLPEPDPLLALLENAPLP
jgi:hypothetical protein